MYANNNYLLLTATCVLIVVCGCVLVKLLFVPWLRKRRRTVAESKAKGLGYNAWLTTNDDDDNDTKIYLRDEVANYANDRYPPTCRLRSRWHVFLRSAELGRPFAVRFDRFDYSVDRVDIIDNEKQVLRGMVLRERAECADSWLESQFERKSMNIERDEIEARNKLLDLAKRYSYEIAWETGETDSNAEKLCVTFVDRSLGGKRYTFKVDGYRRALLSDEIPSTQTTLPPAWTIERDTRHRHVDARKTDPSVNSGADAIATVDRDPTTGVYPYELSPCYDKTLGKQTSGKRPVTGLKEYEEYYLRGIQGRYPAEARPELQKRLRERFFIDCRSDTSVNQRFIDDQFSISVFPLRAYLDVCPPGNRFSAKRRKCVKSST